MISLPEDKRLPSVKRWLGAPLAQHFRFPFVIVYKLNEFAYICARRTPTITDKGTPAR